MPRSHPPYAPEYRWRFIELARAGRSINELAREFEPSANAIRYWLKQAGPDAGLRSDGLTTDEREERNRLRRENRVLREEREILAKAATWCVSRTRARARDAVPKMGVGLPKPACRGRLQTARCCCVQKAWW
jgi:transposase